MEPTHSRSTISPAGVWGQNNYNIMYEFLKNIYRRPAPWEKYTAEKLWNDKHISERMLKYHLNEDVEPASRNKTFMDESIAWIVSHFNIRNNTKVCDFGCGPGLYSTQFAKTGAEVTGIDFSKRSIQYAKKTAKATNLNIDYIQQNYLEYTADKKFDLITMIYCDFCALSPKQRKKLFGQFSKCLNDDGFILLDVFSMDAFAQREETAILKHLLHDGFWSAKNYYGFMNTYRYQEEKVVLDKYTIIEKSKTWEVYNWLQYYSLESLKKEFEENGLCIHEYYSDVRGTSYKPDSSEIAIVASKNI